MHVYVFIYLFDFTGKKQAFPQTCNLMKGFHEKTVYQTCQNVVLYQIHFTENTRRFTFEIDLTEKYIHIFIIEYFLMYQYWIPFQKLISRKTSH